MKDGIVLLVVALSLILVSGCGNDDDSSSDGICDIGCAIKRELNCPNDDLSACKPKCEQWLAQPTCQAENIASAKCWASYPASQYECNDLGNARLKEGLCEPEDRAATICLLNDMGIAGNGGGG